MNVCKQHLNNKVSHLDMVAINSPQQLLEISSSTPKQAK